MIGKIKLQGLEVVKMEEFKYLKSTIQSYGPCREEVKKSVQTKGNG